MKKFVFAILAIFLVGGFALPALALQEGTGASIAFSEPTPSAITVNTVFEIKVNLTTGGNNVDEVDLEITFPKDKLQLEPAGVAKTADFPDSAEPNQSQLDNFNQDGKLSFDAKRSTNLSANGTVVVLKFKAIAPGEAELHITDNTFGYETDVSATDKTITIAGAATPTPTTPVTTVVTATPTTVPGKQVGPADLTGTGPEDTLLFSLAGALGIVMAGWVLLKSRQKLNL